MTHGQMKEIEGDFTELAPHGPMVCLGCGHTTMHRCQRWDSKDGAYEDYKHTCLECGYVEWMEGIDS